MKTRVDPAFRAEVERYALRFTCEQCAHFAEESGACGNGYPNAAHRERELEQRGELEFCKEFELA